MAEHGMEYSKKIEFRKIFKVIRRTILVIIILFIFIIIAGASVSIILNNDTADGLASKEERESIEKWTKED